MDAPEWLWSPGVALTTQERAVYAALLRIRNRDGDRQSVYPSQEYIARSTGLGERTVRRVLASLAAFGVIEVRQRRRPGVRRLESNSYIVNAYSTRPDLLTADDQGSQGPVVDGHDQRPVGPVVDYPTLDSPSIVGRPRATQSRPEATQATTTGRSGRVSPPIEALHRSHEEHFSEMLTHDSGFDGDLTSEIGDLPSADDAPAALADDDESPVREIRFRPRGLGYATRKQITLIHDLWINDGRGIPTEPQLRGWSALAVEDASSLIGLLYSRIGRYDAFVGPEPGTPEFEALSPAGRAAADRGMLPEGSVH